MSDRVGFLKRIEELNACKSSEEVAELLRKDGVKGEKNRGGFVCEVCAIARDLQRFEPKTEVGYQVWIPGERMRWALSQPVVDFICAWDLCEYPDLVAP